MAVDLAQISRLTNLQDVHRLLHDTLSKEISVDAELNKLLGRRVEFEARLLQLNPPTREALELVRADAEQLLASVRGTSAQAEAISSKVRRLDLAQSRVQETLAEVNLILDRTNCIHGVQQAMENGDYASAAQYIATFMSLEEKLSRSAVAQHADDLAQAAEQRQLLLDAKSRLEAVVEKHFGDAASRRDQPEVVKYARLYKLLGRREEGLKRFLDFLQLSIGARARSEYHTLSEKLDGRKPVDFAATLTLLFKDLALAYEEHEAFVAEVFGRPALLELASALQAVCDEAATRVLQRYLEARKVDKQAKELASSRKRQGAMGGASALTGGGASPAGAAQGQGEHRKAEASIEELLVLCQRCEQYNGFFLGRMREAVAPDQLSPQREMAFRSGSFNISLRELLGCYMALEEFYLEETSAMAIRIDEAVGDALTSSMVDDVFFIMKKVAMRALATGSVPCICAILAEMNNTLANAYRAALAARLQPGPARLLAQAQAQAAGIGGAAAGSAGGAGGAAASGGTPDRGGGAGALAPGASDYAVALNNADVSAEYLSRLRTELDAYLSELFGQPGGERDRLKSALADLAKTGNDLRAVTGKALEQTSDALMAMLRPAVDEVASTSFELSEAQLAAMEGDQTWAHRLVGALGASYRWLQPLLTAANYDALFATLVEKLCTKLEVLLSRKAFNQLGGLQLDRDLRLLVAGLGEMSSRTVRDKFARLSQMAIILGLESVQELLDYWGADSNITWRLTPVEVRSCLGQRSDFARDAVLSLPL